MDSHKKEIEFFAIISGILTGLIIITAILHQIVSGFHVTPKQTSMMLTVANLQLYLFSPLTFIVGFIAIWRIRRNNKRGFWLAFTAICFATFYPMLAFLLATLMTGYAYTALIGVLFWLMGLPAIVIWGRS